MATRATNEKPTRREMVYLDRSRPHKAAEAMNVELAGEFITLRPPRARRGSEREVRCTVGWLYDVLIERTAARAK